MPKRPPNSPTPSRRQRAPDPRPRVIARALIAAVRLYQVALSPWLPAACRFAPSCSTFTREAIARHGPRRGLRLAFGRIARCHPWHAGGYDPVPEA